MNCYCEGCCKESGGLEFFFNTEYVYVREDRFPMKRNDNDHKRPYLMMMEQLYKKIHSG